MAYVTAITDRDQADIETGNSKAYFNVADWERIYGNTQDVNTEVFKDFAAFTSLSTPTTATIPTAANLNTLLANIEWMRLGIATNFPALVASEPLFVEIKDDWTAGQSNTAPTFLAVNSWEKVLDILHGLDPLDYPGYRELESESNRLLENGDTRILG